MDISGLVDKLEKEIVELHNHQSSKYKKSANASFEEMERIGFAVANIEKELEKRLDASEWTQPELFRLAALLLAMGVVMELEPHWESIPSSDPSYT